MFSLILCKYRCILTTFQWSLMLIICDTIFINLLVQRLRMTSHFLVDSICEKTSLPFFSMPVDRAFHARQNWLIFSISKDGSLGEKHRKNWVISLKHSGFRSFSSCLAKYMHLMDFSWIIIKGEKAILLLHRYFQNTSTSILQWYFHGTSMVLQRYFHGTSTILQWYSNGTSTILHRYFHGTSLILPKYFVLQYFSDTSMVLQRYSTDTPMVLHQYFADTSMVLHRYFKVSEVSLFPPWYHLSPWHFFYCNLCCFSAFFYMAFTL